MLVVLLLCCAGAWWFMRKWHLQRLTANIPTMSGALPFIGHAHKLIGNGEHTWEYLQRIETETINSGGIMKFWLGPVLVFGVTDPNIAQTLFNTFEEKMYVSFFLQNWLNQGLFTANFSTWRRHRKLLNPTFSQKILNGYLQTFNEMSVRFVEQIEKELGKDEFDIIPYLKNVTLETICQTALGLSSTETTKICNNEYIYSAEKMLLIISTRIKNIWMHPSSLYNWTKTKKEEDDVIKILKSVSQIVLSTKKAEMKEGISKKNEKSGRSIKGFLDYLLELQSEGLLTDQEITEEVDTMILAGTDTTANTMIFVLIVLASYPDVQDRIYDEIQHVLAESPYCCDVNIGHLTKFVYMEAVLKETMRMYPIGPMVARQVTRNYNLDNLYLPAGSAIVAIISGVNKSACWGNDAESFRPERWLDGSLPENPAAFATFSLGRRSCIGRNYAMMSMKTTLVHLLRRYRLSRNETKLRLKWDFMLLPVAGHLLSIELRQ